MIPTFQILGAPDLHPEKPVKDAYDLASGKVDMASLRITGHCVRVFDLMDENDRRAYDELYVDLAEKAKKGKIVISSNAREVLTRKDGSTGWFKYLEWTEFDTSEILGA